MTVTINPELNESLGVHSFDDEDGLLEFSDQANAAEAGLANFDRNEMKLEPEEEVQDRITYQGERRAPFMRRSLHRGGNVSYLKRLGSLLRYGQSAFAESLTDDVCEVSEPNEIAGGAMANSVHENVALRCGVPIFAELYLDLSYLLDGSLIITKRPDRTLFAVAAERSRLAHIKRLVTADASEQISVAIDSMCFYSDSSNVIDVAETARAFAHEFVAA